MSPIDTSSTSATTSSTSATQAATNEAADRFLKLLVAQMQHQDPLNPMDNAEVTTQMAQISTVSGIEKMNKSIEAMSAGFAQMQAMQGVSLVGRGVLLEGNRLLFDEAGATGGSFELDSPADRVRVDILSTSGALLDSFEMGAQGAGRHRFDWIAGGATDPRLVGSFQVTAGAGAAALAPLHLMHDKVSAVRTGGGQLTLDLASGGSAAYSQIKAFN